MNYTSIMETKRNGRSLPKGWQWVKLGDVCKQDRQIVEPNSALSSRLLYLSLEHIESNSGRILREPTEPIQDERKSTTFHFDNRHVLYGKLRPYLNKVALPDFEGRCTTELIPILPTDIDRKFLAWVLRRKETVDAAMQERTGSRMPRANMDNLFALEVPLPPLDEQRQIASRLNEQLAAVESARKAAEEQWQAARQLPSAYLREVFEGQAAKKYPHKQLGDLCQIKLGKMLSPASRTGTRSRPYLRNLNVQWGYFDLSDIAEMDFKEGEEEKYELRPGDLLVCEGGEPGRAAVWNGEIQPCYYQKALHRLRSINNSVDTSYVMYRLWLGAVQKEFIDSNAHTTIAHLPKIRLEKLSIPVPPLEEQKRIVDLLKKHMTGANEVMEMLESQLAEINRLPASLLREAFAGQG